VLCGSALIAICVCMYMLSAVRWFIDSQLCVCVCACTVLCGWRCMDIAYVCIYMHRGVW
jgi:hypothetical protein